MFRFIHRTISTVHSAALLLGAAGFLSRVLGLVRDRLLASRFGASRELDAYYAAFQVPDFIYSVLLLGAASMAILPLFVERESRSREEAERFIQSLITFFLIAASVILCIGIFAAPFLIKKLFPGFDDIAYGNAVFLTRIIFLSPLFLGVSGILSSVVQVHHKFVAYALAGIAYNVGIILGILVLVPYGGVRWLGFGVVIGALLHFCTQFAAYRSLGFSLRGIRRFWNSSVKEVLFLSAPRVISLSLSQITLVIMMGIASTLREGSLAVFQFANNLGFLPLGIFAVSYATALFPRLSENAVQRDAQAFFQNIFFGVRTVLLWIVPLVFLFVVLRAHIVRVVLGAGAFDWADTRLTAAAFAILSIALIGESMNAFFIRGFYALKETWLPLAMDAIATGVSVIGAFMFTRLFQTTPAFTDVFYSLLRITDVAGSEVLGIVCGFSLGIIVRTMLLMVGLFVRTRSRFNTHERADVRRQFSRSIGQIFLGGLGAGITAYYALQFFSQFFILDSFTNVFFEGCLAGIAGGIIYVLVLYAMKNEDLRSLFESLHKRFFSIEALPQHWNGEKTTLE